MNHKFNCVGQTHALINGRELFTKSSISDYLPSLRPFLYRELSSFTKESLKILDEIKLQLLDLMAGVNSAKKGNLCLLSVGMIHNFQSYNFRLFSRYKSFLGTMQWCYY